MPRSSIAPSDVDSMALNELEQLMKEFPEWKEQYPDLYTDIHPPRHSKGQQKKRENVPVRSGKPRSQTVPLSDYRDTYKNNYNIRPRSTKRPPPSPRDPNPPPMVFDTNQRHDFQPKFLENGRVLPIKKEEVYNPPEEPMECKSHYTMDYPAKFVLPPVIHGIPEKAVRGTMQRRSGSFDGRTTTKEHYQKWSGSGKAVPYGEVPCFTGSLLYPDQTRSLDSTTGQTFQGAKGKRAELIKNADANIKLEGDQHFDTVNRSTYKFTEGARRADIIVHKPEYKVVKRGNFNAVTQSQHDFAHHKDARPAKAVAPPQSTVDLRRDNRMSLDTEQRNQFKGYDVTEHPMPKSCKKETEEYKPPTEKVDSLTSQKADYKEYDISQNFSVPIKNPHQGRRSDKPLPPLDPTTTSSQHYQKWKVEPRTRYEDIYEANMFCRRDQYMPTDPFNTVSTTRDTYQGKYAPVPKSLKPEERAVDKQGDHDFNTVYKVQFHQPTDARLLSKQQAARLLKELRKKKGGKAQLKGGSQPQRVQVQV